jgi:hypothetical protein
LRAICERVFRVPFQDDWKHSAWTPYSVVEGKEKQKKEEKKALHVLAVTATRQLKVIKVRPSHVINSGWERLGSRGKNRHWQQHPFGICNDFCKAT